MKLMQLNMWLGYVMHSALQYIQDEQVDILCAQEVLSSPADNPLFNTYQTHQRLSKLFPYQFFTPTYSFEALGETVELGNAIYAKFPISNPHTTFTHGAYQARQNVANFVRNIRVLQDCTLSLPDGRNISLANHHGFHDLDPNGTPETKIALSKAAQALSSCTRPLIFCGDLNVQPSSPALRALQPLDLRNLTAESGLATTLSQLSRLKHEVACDYIFVDKAIHVTSFSASETLVSDHKPLILAFET